MTDFSQVEFAMLGFILGILLGFVGVILWRNMGSSERPRRRRPLRTVSCLLCGRPNPVAHEDQENARLVCRCGQSLYIAGLNIHPHPRPH